MPVKIKPIHDLGPCTLNLESVKGICSLIDREFHDAFYMAEDGIWIIHSEPSGIFLAIIEERDKLDSFIVEAGGGLVGKEVKLMFNKEEAKVVFDVHADDADWVEHFMLDLKKHIIPPSFRQSFSRWFEVVELFAPLIIPFVRFEIRSQQPYCRIVLKPKDPNQRLLGIGDNIVANVLYDIIKIAIVAAATLFATWLLRQFGVDILGVGS